MIQPRNKRGREVTSCVQEEAVGSDKEQRESFGLFQLIKVKTECCGGDVNLGNKTQKKE